MEKREDAVLDMDIYHLERNGARENAGSNPEDVSTGEGMAAMPQKDTYLCKELCLLSLPCST
jgi:hypothetical protein